jgi:hypothetical protein
MATVNYQSMLWAAAGDSDNLKPQNIIATSTSTSTLHTHENNLTLPDWIGLCRPNRSTNVDATHEVWTAARTEHLAAEPQGEAAMQVISKGA